MIYLRNTINNQFRFFDRDEDVLVKMVSDYPASALARLALLKKYKESGNPQYQDLKESSALHMVNIPWYLFVLTQAGAPELTDSAADVVADKPDDHVAAHREESIDTGLKTAVEREKMAAADQDKEMDPAEENLPLVESEVVAAPALASLEEPTEADEEPERAGEKEIAADQDKEMDLAEENLPLAEPEVIAAPAATSLEEPTEADEEPERAGEKEIAADQDKEMDPAEENVHFEGPEVIAAPATTSPEEPTEDAGEPEGAGEKEVAADQDKEMDLAEENLPFAGSEPDAFPAVAQKPSEGQENYEEDPPASAGDLEFEPLYTVDYFASQGIKLNESDLKEDKLYQQVKSFTGWLKSMKKLHPGKLPEQNEVIERIIQSSSERSNVGSDVLTEAMAEVLVKQNKKEKAVEMYEKLSLMNPSKSAYFAAKIQSLKTT